MLLNASGSILAAFLVAFGLIPIVAGRILLVIVGLWEGSGNASLAVLLLFCCCSLAVLLLFLAVPLLFSRCSLAYGCNLMISPLAYVLVAISCFLLSLTLSVLPLGQVQYRGSGGPF